MSGLRRNLPYKKILECIQEYYKISYPTAKYLYFRGLRSIRKDENSMPLDITVQLAIIEADTSINWGSVNIGEETAALTSKGLPAAIYKNAAHPNNEDNWKTVMNKKKKRELSKAQKIIKGVGLHV